VAAAFCALALLVAASRNISLGFFLIGLEILVVFTMRQLGLHASARRISQEQRQEAREMLTDSARPVVRKFKKSA